MCPHPTPHQLQDEDTAPQVRTNAVRSARLRLWLTIAAELAAVLTLAFAVALRYGPL